MARFKGYTRNQVRAISLSLGGGSDSWNPVKTNVGPTLWNIARRYPEIERYLTYEPAKAAKMFEKRRMFAAAGLAHLASRIGSFEQADRAFKRVRDPAKIARLLMTEGRFHLRTDKGIAHSHYSTAAELFERAGKKAEAERAKRRVRDMKRRSDAQFDRDLKNFARRKSNRSGANRFINQRVAEQFKQIRRYGIK